MKQDISVNNKIIGMLGAFFFVSPNLNILESVLSYCGIESHDTVRLISIGVFCALDLMIAILFLISKPGKGLFISLIVFNAVYILPILINRNVTEVFQYVIFVVPVTIFAVMMAADDDIKSSFFRYLFYASRILMAAAVIYIAMQYLSDNRDENGVVIIRNMTYGDMGYLFLTGFVISLVESCERRSFMAYAGIILFSLAIFFSGTRSAMLCVIFAVFLFVIFSIFDASNRRKAAAIIICASALIIVVSMFAIPEGSRLNFINFDVTSSDFSIRDLIFETKADETFDREVIYSPTGEKRMISEIYEEQIIKNDCLKSATEDMLHEDVASGRYEYVTLITEDDRPFAENYRPFRHRTFLWRTAYQEFKKHPVLGNGPCYYKIKYDGFFPHNVLLEAMADYGIVGLVIVLALGIWCFVVAFKHSVKDHNKYYFYMSLLLFSHLPRYLLYTTLYSNTTIAMTILIFLIPELIKKRSGKKALIDEGQTL